MKREANVVITFFKTNDEMVETSPVYETLEVSTEEEIIDRAKAELHKVSGAEYALVTWSFGLYTSGDHLVYTDGRVEAYDNYHRHKEPNLKRVEDV